MAYLDKVLRPGETVQFHGSLHWLIYARGLLLVLAGLVVLGVALAVPDRSLGRGLAVGAAALLLIAAWRLIVAGIRRQAVEFVVTDKRVIYKTGLLSRHTAEINISKIESVDVDQGILGRIFGYGTVFLRGTGASLEPLQGVADPIGCVTRSWLGRVETTITKRSRCLERSVLDTQATLVGKLVQIRQHRRHPRLVPARQHRKSAVVPGAVKCRDMGRQREASPIERCLQSIDDLR